MKKNITTQKTPAPATKLTTPLPAEPAVARKSTVAPKIKKTEVAAETAPAVVAKPKAANVTLTAHVDVGFGNSVSVRGGEPYLSWTKGKLLGCVADNKWEIVLTGVDRPFEFKFLRNDTDWSTGENFTADPGDALALTPSF